MASQRIKGQEVEVLLIVDDKPKTNLTAIKDFEFTPELDILSEGYLGEFADRKDEVMTGIAGKMTMHFENQDIFKFMQQVIDRAQRRTPGTKINIKSTLNFPNGQRPRILLPDVAFGSFPVSFSSRKDYGSVSISFAGSKINFLY